MTASHQQFLERYTSALPATVTPEIDRARNVVKYEIRGPELSVKHEIAKIGALLAVMPGDVKWTARFGAPMLTWEGDRVSFGEVFVPRTATKFWETVTP